MARNPKTPRAKAVKKLDEQFSRYIRLRSTDHRGYGRCFTCSKEMHWKSVDAGHFQTRSKYATRWDEQNVQFQCKHCNMSNGGQQYEFGLKLDEVYGEGTADNILIKSNKTAKYTLIELKAMAEHYRKLANELE
jgi:hypothetical protein